jgi:nitroreductase
MMERLSWPDVLSIGAAIQTMLLAIHDLGYGACWMNEPAIAAGRMNEVLGVPAEQRFVSIIPVGRPAIAPRPKTMKDRASVFTLMG